MMKYEYKKLRYSADLDLVPLGRMVEYYVELLVNCGFSEEKYRVLISISDFSNLVRI